MSSVRESLFEVIENTIRPIIEQPRGLSPLKFQAQVAQFEVALKQLRQVIEVKSRLDWKQAIPEALSKGISIDKISKMELLTLDEMIEVELPASGHKSLKRLLTQSGLFQEFEDALALDFDYLSTVTAEELCQLAMAGDLDAIKRARVSSFRINQLVSWAVTSAPATYMGTYNSVMIAVAHRQFEVVKYLVDMGAKLRIQGGRLSNLTAQDCAGQLSMLFPAPDQQLVNYLNKKASDQSRKSYRDVVLHSFFNPAVEQSAALPQAAISPMI